MYATDINKTPTGQGLADLIIERDSTLENVCNKGIKTSVPASDRLVRVLIARVMWPAQQ
jgi:hypothetical protein